MTESEERPSYPGQMRQPLRSAIIAERKDLERAIEIWQRILETFTTNPAAMNADYALSCVDRTLAARKRLTELAHWDTN